ncbi:transposase [Ascidiimonas aurantiaca]|uniref:transposase n=1 Tax=Ascidiimonas aurantiaca TaxID=1685432 RepID=UPI003BB6E80E
MRRSKNIKQLASYVGLPTGIYQSGVTLRHTDMSKRAHRLIRIYFIEASWQAIRTDPVMQTYYR